MSALPPKADICSATSDVRFGPIAYIRTSNGFAVQISPSRTSDLFQPGFAQAFEEFWHLVGRVGNILLAPRDGDVGLQFPEALQRHTGLFNLTGLRKAGDMKAVAGRHPITLLHGLTGEADSLGVSTSEEMRDR